MKADSSRAFLVSALLHGVALAVMLFLTYASTERERKTPRIMELVAGEGDNFGATEAPALGTPEGVKLSLPKAAPAAAEPPRPEPPRAEPPRPEPPKPEPVKAQPAPIVPAKKAPAPVPVPPKPEQKTRTMAQTIRRALIVADSRAKKQVAKERAEEKKRLTKEEFDKAQRTKVASAKGTTPKIEKIDSKGIAKGVVGGSTKNDIGGAGGTALSVEERSDADSYAAGLNRKLTEELDAVVDLKEGLRTTAEFEVLSNGRLVRGKIIRSSGNERFDQAVLHAIAVVRMPMGPPKGFERVQQVTFSSHDKNQG